MGVAVVAGLVLSSNSYAEEARGDLGNYQKPIGLCLDRYDVMIKRSMIAVSPSGGLPSKEDDAMLKDRALEFCMCEYTILSAKADPENEKEFISDLIKTEEFAIESLKNEYYAKWHADEL